MMIMAEKTKKAGRPKSVPVEDTVVNETDTERLEMEKKEGEQVSIEDITAQWKRVFNKTSYF